MSTDPSIPPSPPERAKTNPIRARIHSHVTQSKFLHIEDALALGQGKIRLFAGSYRRGQGVGERDHAHHFIDLPAARVIFGALSRGEQGFEHKEYKGTPAQDGKETVSRVLSVKVKGQNVYIELKTGPGKLTKTGAITPHGRAKAEINVGFKLAEARRMGASVSAYIRAWDVMRMMVHQRMVGQPSAYLQSLTESAPPTAAGKAAAPPTRPPAASPAAPRPATRKTTGKAAKAKRNGNGRTQSAGKGSRNGNGMKNGKRNGRLPAKAASRRPVVRLLYGDGVPVSPDNRAERNAYASYREAKGIVPPSKTVLQDFYRRRTQPA